MESRVTNAIYARQSRTAVRTMSLKSTLPNNGVDEIRNIRDRVKYAPSEAKFKVYIIDEVHMLTTGAFNALPKTLEEPPVHAVLS